MSGEQLGSRGRQLNVSGNEVMGLFKNWFKNRSAADKPAARASGSYRQRMVEAGHETSKPAPEAIDLEPHLHGRVESIGPGKNVFVPSRQVREDSGTHETLRIVDESSPESDNPDGVDPYNTGRFDRSRNWDSRSRK